MYTYLQQSKYACLDACYPAHEALSLIFQLSTKGSDSSYNGINMRNKRELANTLEHHQIPFFHFEYAEGCTPYLYFLKA
jgi:hypothetical protein